LWHETQRRSKIRRPAAASRSARATSGNGSWRQAAAAVSPSESAAAAIREHRRSTAAV